MVSVMSVNFNPTWPLTLAFTMLPFSSARDAIESLDLPSALQNLPYCLSCPASLATHMCHTLRMCNCTYLMHRQAVVSAAEPGLPFSNLLLVGLHKTSSYHALQPRPAPCLLLSIVPLHHETVRVGSVHCVNENSSRCLFLGQAF